LLINDYLLLLLRECLDLGAVGEHKGVQRHLLLLACAFLVLGLGCLHRH
jgi:hypothetical protein